MSRPGVKLTPGEGNEERIGNVVPPYEVFKKNIFSTPGE
jgi:hypothetical protein